jgi:predicted HTH transcriptional regulator
MLTTLRSKTKFNIKLSPQATRYKVDGKNVLAFYIPSSDIKPVYFNGVQNTFIRTGSGDQQASEFEINALYRDQAFGSMSEKAVEGTSVDSLNKASYKRFREYLKGFNPNLHYNTMDDDEFNQRLKIVTDRKLTYGGLLFLGTNAAITAHFSDFRVDYLEIPATNYADAEPRYTFRVEEQENLWEYYFVLFQRLRIYANNPLTIGEMGIGHEDTKEIEALREALVNLLIHTDYFSPMKPRIRVFTNRIEFENPGKLPRTVEELMKTDETLPRNPVLAKFFRLAKLCESAGYGFDKMLQWKKQTGNEVLFETSIDKTKFTFMLDITKAIREESDTEGGTIEDKSGTKNEKSGMKGGMKNEESGMITEKSGIKSGTIEEKGGMIDNKSGMKIKTVDKILDLISKNNIISISQLSKEIGINRSAIQKHIDNLKSNGIIRRDGAGKGGKWVIIKPD